ncbi:MAG: tRNA dihydrouridine synthase DusB [Anaerovoracaceae bacterium]
MKIQLDNKFILAPLAGITDAPFRILCKEQGAALLYTEMISAKGLVYGNDNTKELLNFDSIIDPETEKSFEQPIGIQLFGADTEFIVKAIHIIEPYKNEIIDFNFGCPVQKIVKNGEGSALLKNPDLIYKIIKTAVAETDKEVTAKIRIGWDKDSLNYLEVAQAIEAAGASGIAVHGRTRDQFYTGKADWQAIKEVRGTLKSDISVIGNGDVFSAEDANRMLEETGCDYVMIARGALGNPWIFNDAKRLYQGNEEGKETKMPERTAKEKAEKLIQHFNLLLKMKGEKAAVTQIRKHVGWYLKGLPEITRIKQEVNSCNKPEEFIALISEQYTI